MPRPPAGGTIFEYTSTVFWCATGLLLTSGIDGGVKSTNLPIDRRDYLLDTLRFSFCSVSTHGRGSREYEIVDCGLACLGWRA